jgi:hypothetical protein
VVDLFKLYTFNFGHIFIRAIVWNSLNFCKIYEQVIIFFLLLRPLCFSEALPAAHRRRFPRPPTAPSPLFLRHLAPSSPARPTSLAPPRADTSRRCPLEPPRAPSTASSCLPPARAPLFGFGTRPHSCSFSFSTRQVRRSSSIHHRQPTPFFYSLAHTRIPVLFPSPLDKFTGAPLSTAVSHLRRSSSPILCSTSTAASHCPFLTHSSSSSHACVAQNVAPAISLPAAVQFLVEPKFHPFSFLAKSTISTTSPRRSSLTNSPSPSCTPVAVTPPPPSEPRRAGSVLSQTATSEFPFYDSNHPQVCCELLNLFPHLSLAAGEPPRRILITAARLLLFKLIRDLVASLCFFLGSFL